MYDYTKPIREINRNMATTFLVAIFNFGEEKDKRHYTFNTLNEIVETYTAQLNAKHIENFEVYCKFRDGYELVAEGFSIINRQ
jgi:hypothetical protein